jgi:YD repeat-containing protein
MKALKGINMDARPSDIGEGYYIYGKNGLQTNIDSSITNEQGFVKIDVSFKYTIMGTIESDGLIVIFSTNDINSEIGIFDTDKKTYTIIINDLLLEYNFAFKKTNPIKGEFQKNYNNELIVVWKNNVNPPYIINITNNKATRLEDYLLFPSWSSGNIDVSILSGGSLQKGMYIPVVRYINDGAYSDYFMYGRPAYLSADDNSQLSIELTNLDNRYKKVQVAIISVIKGITKVVELSPVQISNSVSIAYSGAFETETSFESLFAVTPYYTNIKAITQLNDELFLGNVEELNLDKVNYYMQKSALNCKLRWKSTLLSEVVGNKGVYNAFDNRDYIGGKYKTFGHQEVYAFYVVGNLINGRKTKGFIIANRHSISSDLDASTLASGVSVTAKKYQVEDTILNVDGQERTADFGYWENQNETYPTNVIKGYGNPFGILAGEKVRHFKTPSHNYCYNNFYSDANLNYGSKDLDLLSLCVTSFIVPEEIKSLIVSYEIYYAKRNQLDITNLGQSLLLLGAKQNSATGNPIDITSTGGNFSYFGYDAQGDSTKELVLDERVVRFHSFDMLYNKLSIKPDLIINQLKLKKTLTFGASSSISINNSVSDKYEDFEGILNDKGDFDTVFYKTRSVYQVIDYTSGRLKTEVTNPLSTNRVRKLSNYKFTLNNSYFGDIDNRLAESCYTAIMSGGTTNAVRIDDTQQSISGGNAGVTLPRYEISYLSNMLRIVTDVFVNFYNQTLISTGVRNTTSKSQAIYGGDMLISDYSFVTYGRRDYYDRSFATQDSNRFIHRFICETASNINLRNEEIGDVYSKFYPKSDGKFIRLLDKNLNPNNFGYEKELNQLFEENISCFNSVDEPQYKHPFRVIRSSPNQKEKTMRSWRNFAPLDYYEADKNYGEIINLQGLDDKLIIHHLNALYVTRDKAKLTTDILNIVLGSGDIFEFNPIKALESKLGFGGIDSDLGTLVSPLGYHFYKDGRPFIYKEGLKSLSNNLFNFFIQYLQETGKNSYTGNGVVFGYDNYNKRFLMSVKSDKNYTLSYSIETDNWVFFHDYVADYYLHSTNDLYSIKNNSIYLNSKGKKGVYYTDEIKPFFIDVVFRYEKEITLDAVMWTTESIINYLQNEVNTEFNTITHISIRTNHQHTGRIKLYKNNWHDKNYSMKNGQFSFNSFKNIVKRKAYDLVTDIFTDLQLNVNTELIDNWYDKDNLESNFFIVRFEYDNQKESLMILKEVGINFKLSNI